MSRLFCSICGGKEFIDNIVLWDSLIEEWNLSTKEIEYINRQQGTCCTLCNSNLRSIVLANAILDIYSFSGLFKTFVTSSEFQNLKILEINTAGSLTQYLSLMPHHHLISYPEYNMMNLKIRSGAFDLVVHSDTLEHISDPILGLKECKRVLTTNGRCVFTVPIIVNRMSKSREKLQKSYHGSGEDKADYLVNTEFGADIWSYVFQADFRQCVMHKLEYPSAIAIEAI